MPKGAPQKKNGHAREEVGMTALIDQHSLQKGGGEQVHPRKRCAGGGALACGMIGSTREEVGGSETGLVKRRHPGGGGCRHLIDDPTLREEVKCLVFQDLLKGRRQQI